MRDSWTLTRLIGIALFVLAIAGLLRWSVASQAEQMPASTDVANGAPANGSSLGKTPNIIMIMIDTLRADQLGAYGGPNSLTPTIDSIAAEGVLFELAIAQAPWTQPSVASLFSSFYPAVHKVLSYQDAERDLALGRKRLAVFDESFKTLAEILRDRGYLTAAFVANPFIASNFGFEQGFDHYDSSLAEGRASGRPGSALNSAALSWLENRDGDERSKPFFLYLHYMDVHAPYKSSPHRLERLLEGVAARGDKQRLTESELLDLPEPTRPGQPHGDLRHYREYWVARYQVGVQLLDTHLAVLRRHLRKLELWDDAFVVILSDHGEDLFDHGQCGHGESAYHNELHVPLVMRWPGNILPGVRYRYAVELIDVLPTIVDQLNLPDPGNLQGESLVPYLNDPTRPKPGFAFAEALAGKHEKKALYHGGWKFIFDTETGRRELYRIADDVGEKRDLAPHDEEKLNEMHQLMEAQIAESTALALDRVVERAELTREQRRQLEALGYLD